jgi:hypothetical protein
MIFPGLSDGDLPQYHRVDGAAEHKHGRGHFAVR